MYSQVASLRTNLFILLSKITKKVSKHLLCHHKPTYMFKKSYSFHLTLCLLLSLIACQEEKKTDGSDTADKKKISLPNIIYILADDLGYGDLGCYGQEKLSTPNIDALAQAGLLFTQHYSGSTVCAPSRSALLTGQHTGHTYIRGNKEVQPEGQHPIPASAFTIAELLKASGYTTGAFGKWGLGFPGSSGDPMQQGFDTFYGYNCQRFGHHYYPDHLWSNTDSIPLTANADAQNGTYAPELIHEKTIAFIEDNQNQPFFLYVPSIIPHAELAAPDAYMEKHLGKYPPEKTYEGTDDGPDFRKGPYASQEHTHAAFAAMIEILDGQVGEIVQKLEQLGLSEKTLIIFTSDNGPHREGGADPEYFDSNGPLKGFKRDLYEGGIRVPMIAKWPDKIAAGTTTDHISAFWDLFPTLAELVNADQPDDLDGISFLPTLTGQQTQEQHEYLYWEFHERGGRLAIRKGDWKAVRYQVLKNPDVPLELYNLSEDIGETTDLASQHPEIVKEMEDIFEQARTPSEVFSFGETTYLNPDQK